MDRPSMEIICVAPNDIAPQKLSKQEIWWRVQHMKRQAEAQGCVVAIAPNVQAEYGPPVATQAKEQ